MQCAVCVTTVRFSQSRSTGKERDAESGNDYFGARYYASNMGRFLSPDWGGAEDPVPYATLGNPQTLNLYSYVRNNPLVAADINGHCGSDDADWMKQGGFNFLAAACATTFDPDAMSTYLAAFQVWKNSQAQQQTAQGLAAQVPGDVKTAMMASVNASNSPCAAGSACAGDTTGGFHEEGGIWGTNANGSDAVVPATPGPYSAPGDKTAHITPEDSANPALKNNMVQLGGEWHVHPKGGGGREFDQPPSGQDKRVAGTGAALFPIHIVLGAGNSRVYFYAASGEIGHMSFKKFFGN